MVHEEIIDERAADSDTSNEDAVPEQGTIFLVVRIYSTTLVVLGKIELFVFLVPAKDMDDNLSCLSVPGTRKTLYLSGNETVDAEDLNANVSVDVSVDNRM